MDPALVDTAARLVGQLGFPIVVAGWLLFRTDRYLRENTAAIRELIAYLKSKEGKS